ncbi:nuclease [Phenylobacterium sp. LjRoot225]|uniref:thermonuclease family protein n=1 Tax=Phenylobacterium sp. LjRoot225 TaxID=3342285 RepID=UPI003ECC2E2B
MALQLVAPIVASGLVVAALAGCRRQAEPPLQAPPGLSVAERVRVLNADVLVVDGRHVRLAGSAPPQPIPDARCWAEALAAKQATVAVRDLIRAAHDLRIEPTGQTDAYNRSIARVLLDNQDLATTLHDAGLAADAPRGRFGWCDPISKGEAGAPDFRALMDLSPG